MHVHANHCTTRNQDLKIPSKAIRKSGAMHKYTRAMRQNLHIIHPLLKTLRFHGYQMQRERMVPRFVGLTKCWLCLILPIYVNIYDLWYSHSIAPCFCVASWFDSSSGSPSTLPVAGRSRSAWRSDSETMMDWWLLGGQDRFIFHSTMLF